MKNRKGNILIAAGIVLLLAAAGLTAYNIHDSRRAEKDAAVVTEDIMPVLEQSAAIAEEKAAEFTKPGVILQELEYPDYILNPRMDMPVITSDGRDYIGVLSIPSVDIELPVISEWSMDDLKKAPCRYSGSAYLGDLVICAHNYRSHFGRLSRVAIGDELRFTDVDGNVFAYEVAEVEILKPDAIENMIRSEWDLTLFTCTLGGRTRFTVRCEMK